MTTNRAAGIRRGNLTKKLSIRLTPRQHRALAAAAARRGLASADLAREGIALILSAERPRAPKVRRGGRVV